MNIYNVFKEAAHKFPNNKAIIDKDQTITYQELSQAVNNKSNELSNKGILKGDKILVFIPMSISLYVFLLATFKIGATAVFVDEWANKKRLTDCLTKVPCKGFAGNTKAKLLRFFYSPLKQIPMVLSSNYSLLTLDYSAAQEIESDDTALVTFTTGSTSIPKAANRTHHFLMAQYLTLQKELKTKAEDIDLIGLPIVVLCNLGTGATSILPNYNLKKLEKLNPEKLGQYMQKHKVNRVINSPFFFTQMGQSSVKLPQILNIFTGGAPVFSSDVSIFKKSFTDANITVLYGSTEAEPISIISGIDLQSEENNIIKNGLCVGKLSDDIRIKIISSYDKEIINPDELHSLEVNEGEIGEILVSGEHVLKEYLNSEVDTQRNKVKSDSIVWHRTGDAGRVINNKLYLQGRLKQLFKVNNELISPFIYEYLLSINKNIIKGTILYSDRVVAYIQPVKTANKKELKKHLLNEFPIINEVVFISKMPLDARHNSKIDYESLKTRFASD